MKKPHLQNTSIEREILDMPTKEQSFISQLKEGDSKAYKKLYESYYGMLCHAASRYLRDDFLAECVVENVIFNIWERRSQLMITTSVRSYLVMSVRNASINYLKSKYKRNEMLASQLSKEDADWIASVPSGNIEADSIDNDKMLDNILGNLPKDCREVFAMSRLDGMSYKEIADQKGISVNTVKYHIKNAIAILGKVYPEYFAFLVFLAFIKA